MSHAGRPGASEELPVAGGERAGCRRRSDVGHEEAEPKGRGPRLWR